MSILKTTILKIKKLDKDAVIPSYAKYGDAGMDLTAMSISRNTEYIEYGTGLAMEIPYGYVGLLFPRSSVTKKNLIMKNCVGVIDSGYRGEIGFRFYQTPTHSNSTGLRYSHKHGAYRVGDRIGQLILMKIPIVRVEEVDELAESERGAGGYGSTGD